MLTKLDINILITSCALGVDIYVVITSCALSVDIYVVITACALEFWEYLLNVNTLCILLYDNSPFPVNIYGEYLFNIKQL